MRIILIGIQGSGKSTQGNLLSKKLGVPYLATGDIFREMAKEQGEWGRYVKDTLTAGHLIPDDKAIEILTHYIAKPAFQKGFILDGFPRTFTQVEAFTQEIDWVIYIKVSDEEAFKRLRLRTDSQKREDDSDEAMKRRIALFHELTEPLLDFYRKRNLLLEIDGERSIEEIHYDIIAHLGVA